MNVAGLVGEDALLPLVIGLIVHDLHHDRHKGMVLAAQFRALTVINALLVSFEPSLIETAWDRVDLDAEGRHREGMDNVSTGRLNPYDLVHRHDDGVVDAKQPRRGRSQLRTVSFLQHD